MTEEIANHQLRGECTEMQFMARATAQGFMVSKPWANRARYDFLVEHAGRISRVQVKSTSHQRRSSASRAYSCTVVSRNATQAATRYHADQIDFLAAYVVPADAWYIIPVRVLRRLKFAVCLNPHSARSKYARFQEAWDLLRNGAAVPIISADD